ncbi:MAG: dihydropteroate synthase [Bacteroidales bacterium]|nr:dihydropteroate synthase [Bacteroidales bacterium]
MQNISDNMSHLFSLNIKGQLREYTQPIVMGIINVTPDSFYCGSRHSDADAAVATAERMLAQGAAMLDIGGCSTRPGSTPATADEELRRVIPAVEAIRARFPEAVISIDTFRANVARTAIQAGADIINDISAANIDPGIIDVAADLKAPYILMHPADASLSPSTPDEETTSTVLADLQRVLRDLRQRGICDIIIDPGFGFGKTLQQNYRLMADLESFQTFGCPILVGISRKSMINRLLDVDPQSTDSLLGTDILNAFSLLHGADILRVHDVKPAVDAIKIISRLTN